MNNIMMQQRHSTGMTLIELMVVVVIVSILASIAYPSYRQYAIRANRTEAKTTMLEIAQGLEKCYTRFHAYNNAGCGVVFNNVMTPARHYLITGNVTADLFTLTATPQGGQANDTQCGILTVNQANSRRERTDQIVDPTKRCW